MVGWGMSSPQDPALPLWPQLLSTFAFPRGPAWPYLGMAVFAGNPCIGTGWGLEGTLSQPGNLGPPCLWCLATALVMPVLTSDNAV